MLPETEQLLTTDGKAIPAGCIQPGERLRGPANEVHTVSRIERLPPRVVARLHNNRRGEFVDLCEDTEILVQPTWNPTEPQFRRVDSLVDGLRFDSGPKRWLLAPTATEIQFDETLRPELTPSLDPAFLAWAIVSLKYDKPGSRLEIFGRDNQMYLNRLQEMPEWEKTALIEGQLQDNLAARSLPVTFLIGPVEVAKQALDGLVAARGEKNSRNTLIKFRHAPTLAAMTDFLARRLGATSYIGNQGVSIRHPAWNHTPRRTLDSIQRMRNTRAIELHFDTPGPKHVLTADFTTLRFH